MATLSRLLIYTKKLEEMASFYCTHFGYSDKRLDSDRIVELVPPGKGMTLLLHPASKAQRDGQVMVKLVFDVEDVPKAVSELALTGLKFGKIHKVDGYCFANAKDPSGNSIQLSSRAFA